MLNLSRGLRVNFTRLSGVDLPVMLVEIENPALPNTIYLINDECDLVSNGIKYLATTIEIKTISDEGDKLPEATMSIPNIGRQFMHILEEANGGRESTVTFKLVRRCDPNVVERQLRFSIKQSRADIRKIDFKLQIHSLYRSRGIRAVYNIAKYPGLF